MFGLIISPRLPLEDLSRGVLLGSLQYFLWYILPILAFGLIVGGGLGSVYSWKSSAQEIAAG
jgi:hypothetical protein